MSWLSSGARVRPPLHMPPISSRGRNLLGSRASTCVELAKRGARRPKVVVASMIFAHLVVDCSFFRATLLYRELVVVVPEGRCWVGAGRHFVVPVPLPFYISSKLTDERPPPLLFVFVAGPYSSGPSRRSSRRLR